MTDGSHTAPNRSEGRERVRRLLLDRLDEAGMKRPKSMTVEAHNRCRGRLVEELDHMSAESLEALADLVIENPRGRGRDEWLPEATIRSMARMLEPRPVEKSRLLTSWLASVEGPAALAGGYLVELYRHLLAHPNVPPSRFQIDRLRDEAYAARRTLAATARRHQAGTANADELASAELYRRHASQAEAIVAEGAARRAARAEGAADERPE